MALRTLKDKVGQVIKLLECFRRYRRKSKSAEGGHGGKEGRAQSLRAHWTLFWSKKKTTSLPMSLNRRALTVTIDSERVAFELVR